MKEERGGTNNRMVKYGIAFAVLVLFTALAYGCFPFRLDLNDDVLMKDILSGAYTGIPEARNIQMQAPLGALLALLYRLVPAVPWYGVFLCVTQTLCLALVLGRAMTRAKTRRETARTVAFFLAFAAALFLPHAVFFQYTVTCALLSGTAAFFLVTGNGRANDALVLVLLWLSYLVRSEMMLLTLPMCGVALLLRTTKPPVINNIKSNVIVTVLLAAGLGLCFLTNAAVYGSSEWKTFLTLFQNRTELYDFHRIPSYEEHGEFYQSIGLEKSEQELLINYNYGLDESIDETVLGAVADYAARMERQEGGRPEQLSPAALYLYRLRNLSLPDGYLFPRSDMPWNLLTILCYALWLIQLRKLRNVWEPALLFLCRSALWMFILVRGRDPVRITHGLYLVELLIIIGAIIQCRVSAPEEESGMRNKISNGFIIALAVLGTLFCFGSTAPVVHNEITSRIETEEPFRLLYAYMDGHPDCFYFMDVYTWVPYTEKLFEGTGMRPANRDLCGGWNCKSPLYRQKLSQNGFSSMQEALLRDGVFFVQHADRDADWLVRYYADRGETVRIVRQETVGEAFAVYRLVAE